MMTSKNPQRENKLMKSHYRNSMIISLIFFSLTIQVYPINAEIVFEYQAKIGDVMSYSVVKLNHLLKSGEDSFIRKNIQLNRTVWGIYGEKYTYIEQQGTLYTFKVIQVKNNSVCGELIVNNEPISQVNITSLNYFQGFIMKTTSNKTYFEQLSIDNDQYELNQTYLYEKKLKAAGGSPVVTVGVEIYNVWDIKTGWLESCYYNAPDSSLINEMEPRLYGQYEYEIKINNFTKSVCPSIINVGDFLFLSFITLGTSSLFFAIYLTRFKIGKKKKPYPVK